MRLLLLLAIAATAFAQDVRLPNSKLTPGATTGATATALCNKKFHTADVRNVPESEKKAVYAEYGVENHKGYCSGAEGCELDHLISLELGGSNDTKNLWPQPYGEHPGAHEKDRLENWLHRQVCAKRMSLDAAQKAISSNWYLAYQKMLAGQVKNKQSGTFIAPTNPTPVTVTVGPPELPKRFTIGSDKWFLLRVTHLKPGDDGETNCKTRTVSIIEGLEAHDEANTIMHELMHALGCRDGYPHDEVWNNSNDPTDDEGDEGHAGIYLMAPRLLDLVVDNPELVRYLQVQGR